MAHKATEATKYLNLLLKVGSIMILSIGAGFTVGLLLTKWLSLGLTPILIGLLIGISGGFYNVYKTVMRIGDEDVS
jgi:F0F1-type ATP synthase assembly protein I